MYRDTSDFKKSYQSRTNIVWDNKGDLVTDFHIILAKWRNHFSQQLNVHGVINVRQTEMHTAEPVVPEPCAYNIDMAIGKLKGHKSPGVDQIPAEVIKARGYNNSL